MRAVALITGGGTGGHVYPGLSILRALHQRLQDEPRRSGSSLPAAPEAQDHPPRVNGDIIYVGSSRGLERRLVPPTGIPSYFAPMAPPSSPRGVLLLALATLRSLLIVGRRRPRVALGTGGYACVPACLASWLLRVPLVLFLPDVEPGRAVRALLPLARRVAVTTPDSLGYVKESKTVVTGYPLRPAFLHARRDSGRRRFGLGESDTVLCVFGGSLGARAINDAVIRLLPDLLEHAHVIHVSGRDRLEEVRDATASLDEHRHARYHLFPYLDEVEMADALAASDLALARAGASVLGELPATATPAVLVPLPIAGVHQRRNAEYLSRHGAAIVLEDDALKRDLGGVLEVLLTDHGRLEQMAEASASLARPDAADRIAALVLEIAA